AARGVGDDPGDGPGGEIVGRSRRRQRHDERRSARANLLVHTVSSSWVRCGRRRNLYRGITAFRDRVQYNVKMRSKINPFMPGTQRRFACFGTLEGSYLHEIPENTLAATVPAVARAMSIFELFA